MATSDSGVPPRLPPKLGRRVRPPGRRLLPAVGRRAWKRLPVTIDGKDHPMLGNDAGWFELTVEGVAPGTAYQFHLPDGLKVPDPASRRQEGDVSRRLAGGRPHRL